MKTDQNDETNRGAEIKRDKTKRREQLIGWLAYLLGRVEVLFFRVEVHRLHGADEVVGGRSRDGAETLDLRNRNRDGNRGRDDDGETRLVTENSPRSRVSGQRQSRRRNTNRRDRAVEERPGRGTKSRLGESPLRLVRLWGLDLLVLWGLGGFFGRGITLGRERRVGRIARLGGGGRDGFGRRGHLHLFLHLRRALAWRPQRRASSARASDAAVVTAGRTHTAQQSSAHGDAGTMRGF